MPDKNQNQKIALILSEDPILRPVIQKHEALNLEKSCNVYNELVKNIAYQQISYKAADTIFARFIKLMGTMDYNPETVLNHSFETIKAVGFSRQKTEYILAISHYFKEQNLLDFNWEDNDDYTIIKMLTEIKGVGVWTAKMILIFQLQRPDVFPHEDLAIRQMIALLYGIDEKSKSFKSESEKIAARWKPYRTIASLYLWSYKRSLINKAN